RGEVERPCVADIQRALAASEPEPSRAERLPGSSAVLIAIYRGVGDAPVLLYTRRASTMRRHAGELSFPGGRIDASDEHPLAAALREAEEEVGLAARDVRVLGHLTDMTTHYGVLVSAYVGLVDGPPPEEPRSREEVDEVIPVPVEWLFDDWRYEARAHVEMPDRRVHYWQLPGATLWGITGELTARLLSRAWGWEPPARVRLIDDVSEFRPTST
ncbi:MAG TPA: CoA pyrophosphatase, partial [Candidatus Thermoplasmatota archaeon]|nr:CoA pyrophosphatase [Candidatus Thermoplasmatota archaeon]